MYFRKFKNIAGQRFINVREYRRHIERTHGYCCLSQELSFTAWFQEDWNVELRSPLYVETLYCAPRPVGRLPLHGGSVYARPREIYISAKLLSRRCSRTSSFVSASENIYLVVNEYDIVQNIYFTDRQL